MRVFVLAALVAMAAAWQPGARDQCNPTDVNGGTVLLPHERYCQLFYLCDLEGNQKTLFCPGRLLFAYGVGIATCVPNEGFNTFQCPKWSCSTVNDIGRRYPDTCCSKYWECSAVNQFTEKVCSPGESYDSVSEQCRFSSAVSCTDNQYCIDNVRPSNINDCRDSPSNDPCLYKSEGWPFDRQCPVGTSFDVGTCSCSQFNSGCTASGLSAEVLLRNKEASNNCAASGRISWTSNRLTVVSDKLNQNVDHYFYTSPGFSVNGQEGVFVQSNNVQPFIYDYFYNDNTLYAPLAIVMTVRFDFQNPQLNSVYSLLENRWTTDSANQHCNPTTLSITARYNGVNLGDRQWEFGISATGENNLASTGSVTVNGQSNEYFRIVFTFGVRAGNQVGIGGSVTRRGQSGQISNGNPVSFNTDNRNMGSALRPNKCGFAIGRGLTGRIREFSVHEGCSSFANLG